MKLTSVSKDSISDITNGELVNLHLRIHQLWAQRKYKKIDIQLLKKCHVIIVDELSNRGLKHTEDAMKKVISGLETYLEGLS